MSKKRLSNYLSISNKTRNYQLIIVDIDNKFNKKTKSNPRSYPMSFHIMIHNSKFK